jgi:hypothetical protein
MRSAPRWSFLKNLFAPLSLLASPLCPSRYKPETKQDKSKRLKSVADTVAAGKKADAGKKVRIARFHFYKHVPLTCCFAHCSPSCSSSASTTSRISSRTGPPSWCVAAAAFQSCFQLRISSCRVFSTRVCARDHRSALFSCPFAHSAHHPPSPFTRWTPFSPPVFKPHSRLSSLTMLTPSSLLCGCPPSAASELLSSFTSRVPCG